MTKISTHLYEITKKEIKTLNEDTQVLVFNPFSNKYYIEYPATALIYSAKTCYFFLFDVE